MAALLMAMDIIAADVFGTGTEKRIGRRNDVFFERHGAGDKFESRTGLIDLGYDLVFPESLQKFFIISLFFVLCTDKCVEFLLGQGI